MRVLIDDKVAVPLTAEQERDIRLSRPEKAVTAVVLSGEDATHAYISQTKWLFIVLSGICLVITSGVVLLAEPSDQVMMLGGVLVANLALAAFLFLLLRRRTKIWDSKLGLRKIGLAPAGSAVELDDTAIRIGDRNFPWASLRVEQVQLAEFTSQRTTVYTIERLVLAGSSGQVVLDPVMMRNGRLIVDNAWRRLHPATS